VWTSELGVDTNSRRLGRQWDRHGGPLCAHRGDVVPQEFKHGWGGGCDVPIWFCEWRTTDWPMALKPWRSEHSAPPSTRPNDILIQRPCARKKEWRTLVVLAVFTNN